MKYCIKCKHYRELPHAHGDLRHTCVHDNNRQFAPNGERAVNPVTGIVEWIHNDCSTLRRLKQFCGPNGAWFEEFIPPKPEDKYRGPDINLGDLEIDI